ncbi:MAG: Tex-like N-terminal domain-containing protein [Mycoplasmatales bacterium]
MNDIIIKELQTELNIKEKQITTVLSLLEEGATVPFIARYRKEVTGSLDEDQIRNIEKKYTYLLNLENRKEEVKRLIEEKGMLTPELSQEIDQADVLQKVEDLYLPYKEKKKTKATEAIKNGLEPLADFIYLASNFEEVKAKAKEFITENVKDMDAALEGASFIIAERISDNAKYRELIRKEAFKNASIQTKAKRKIEELDPQAKYKMYYDFEQNVSKLPGYRTLAFNRGEKEKILNVKLELNTEFVEQELFKQEVSKIEDTKIKKYILESILDALKRLILPSIEREVRSSLTEKAELGAIELFSQNLDKLIMQPPYKEKWILGVDPAFRTGCKLAVINPSSKLMKIDVIYPHPMQGKENTKDKIWEESNKKLQLIFKEFTIEHIVVGNGTASRETETFLKHYIKDIDISIISESGASVYSASKVAQDEFPDLQVEERSAVSIARRFQDPMAELVKIEPKAIGVGQYQHDVNQKLLSENLDFVMVKNINQVGVDINTASVELLKYVSGLDKAIAKNIIALRDELGVFTNRKQIKDVKRLGAKAFEQCAGFLKIANGDDIFDSTFIHPESYKLAKQLLKELGISKEDISTDKAISIIDNVNKQELAFNLDVDIILITDILEIFKKPTLDIRQEVNTIEFDQSISSIDDLTEGLVVNGQVRNIVEFGAFVDIGLKNDGLVHISELSNNFVKNVSDIVSIGDVKKFRIKEFNKDTGKIQLSLKEVN